MRRPHDFYETAPWQVDALCDHLPELGGSIWCPCVGDGSLVQRLLARRPDFAPIVTNDIDTAKLYAEYHYDAVDRQSWKSMVALRGAPDWVVENPPFNLELPILQQAYRVAKYGVAFMARISFTEPTRDRGAWLRDHPYQKRITLERYSFTGNGKSDSATTDWLIWSKIPLSGPFGISAYGYRGGLR